ncbi:MAG: MarR family transcriptional regulator [Arachnia sp.]
MHLEDAGERGSEVIARLVRWLRTTTATPEISASAASSLARLNNEGPLGVTQLARSEGVSQPAMSQLVERLHRSGLVDRVVPEADRRAVLVVITDEGRAVLDERHARRAERLAELFGLLDRDDQRAILAALPALERLAAAITLLPADGAQDPSSTEGSHQK